MDEEPLVIRRGYRSDEHERFARALERQRERERRAAAKKAAGPRKKKTQTAKIRPPFPSCDNYDAKAWRFIRQHASPGALFWNVAA